MNLLRETIEEISKSGHKPEEIIFIGSEETGHSCTWEEFKLLSDFEYGTRCEAEESARDLIIVFSDGMKMWRGACEGSQWWEYSTPFKRPKEIKQINSIFTDVGWSSLGEINSVALDIEGKAG